VRFPNKLFLLHTVIGIGTYYCIHTGRLQPSPIGMCHASLRSRRFGFWRFDVVSQMMGRLLMSEQAETSLVLPLGPAIMPNPRRQRWVAGTMAILIRALTKPHTSEYDLPHFSASRADNFFSTAFPSLPIIPSVEVTKRREIMATLLSSRLTPETYRGTYRIML